MSSASGLATERMGGRGRPLRTAVLTWLALQAGYQLVPDAWLAETLFPILLVKPTGWLAASFGLQLATSGTTLWLPRGSLTIVRGCDGSDLLCALLAVLAASQAPVAARLRAALMGSLLLHGLNLLRLACLCWLVERAPQAFALVHEWAAPAVLVGAVGLAWWRWHLRQLRACALAAMRMQGSHLPPASTPTIKGSQGEPS